MRTVIGRVQWLTLASCIYVISYGLSGVLMTWSFAAEAKSGIGQCGDASSDLVFASPDFMQWAQLVLIAVIPAGLLIRLYKLAAPVSMFIGALVGSFLLATVLDDLVNGTRVLCESTKGVEDPALALIISHVFLFFFCILELVLRFAVGQTLQKKKSAEENKK